MNPGRPDAFPPTRHSVVRAIASADPEARRDAYGTLVGAYWRPVYAYIRFRWRRDPSEAQDLTQEFFARAFEKEYLAQYDPARARFRTFVRTCLDAFLANERQSATRLKRGGRVVLQSLDFSAADRDLAEHVSSPDPDPEAWFRAEWIRSLFGDTVDQLRARCEATGRTKTFILFRRYDLERDDETYAALARELDISVTDVTNQLAWARRTFREIVLDKLRAFCATDEEFEAEARDVLGITPS